MAEAELAPDVGNVRWLHNADEPPRWTAWHTAGCVALVLTLALAALDLVSHAGHVRTTAFRVTSGSMEPTIAVGQIVHVDESAYATAAPRIGDIVAFYAPAGATAAQPLCGGAQRPGAACSQPTPAESDQVFIKRVVAGPRDTIAVVDGTVLRDGVLEVDPSARTCDLGAGCNLPTAVRIPAGEWFLMGDDRARSDDSRYWGPVPTAWIIGKVVH